MIFCLPFFFVFSFVSCWKEVNTSLLQHNSGSIFGIQEEEKEKRHSHKQQQQQQQQQQHVQQQRTKQARRTVDNSNNKTNNGNNNNGRILTTNVKQDLTLTAKAKTNNATKGLASELATKTNKDYFQPSFIRSGNHILGLVFFPLLFLFCFVLFFLFSGVLFAVVLVSLTALSGFCCHCFDDCFVFCCFFFSHYKILSK